MDRVGRAQSDVARRPWEGHAARPIPFPQGVVRAGRGTRAPQDQGWGAQGSCEVGCAWGVGVGGAGMSPTVSSFLRTAAATHYWRWG
jgi:hypothetical protein